MSIENVSIMRCDCDGHEIPADAPHVEIGFTFVNVEGVPGNMRTLHFCSQAHVAAFISEQPEFGRVE